MKLLLTVSFGLLSFGLLLSAAARDASAAPLRQVVVPSCLVSLIEEVEVPAREAGVLVELSVRAGMQVKAGTLLGSIDDRRPKMQKQLAEIEYRSAKESGENDINVRYARAAAQVAEAEYLAAVAANQRVAGAIASAEVRRLRLDVRRAVLQIEQAEMEQKMLSYEVLSATAQVEAAQEGIRRRSIVAPIDGVVVEVRRHRGEWVNPGDPVVRIVRVDRLRVEGFLKATDFGPDEISGRPVSVAVELTRGRREKFSGRIVFVSPLIQGGGEYRVWAEVENRAEAGQWLLRPGQNATMTIR